jgi:Family of unknown function (DUF6328)
LPNALGFSACPANLNEILQVPQTERASLQGVQKGTNGPDSRLGEDSDVKLDRRIKTALDETRLLILGSQVLFGFLLQSVFQNAFEMLSRSSQLLVCAALSLMVLSIGCLIAPSMQHRIVEAGQSSVRLERAASRLAAWGLLPFIASLGLALFIVFERIFGGIAGSAVGIASGALAGFFWFGLAWLIGDRRRQTMAEEPGATPLSTKIEQMLTEARVIIPGCQALLGFQLIAMLTRAFDELPFDAKIMHAAGLCSVAIATILLMTPAALHRESFGGDDSESFLRLGSAFVMAASLPLALGIAADVYVVFLKITHSVAPSIAASLALLLAMLLLWYLYPIWLRQNRK